MNRREFLKSALTIAALAPVTRLAAGTGADGDKTSDAAEGAQVTRRRYKNTALTVPLLGFGSLLAKGVREAIQTDGLLGVLTGGLTSAAAGITAALFFSLIVALIFKPKDKG